MASRRITRPLTDEARVELVKRALASLVARQLARHVELAPHARPLTDKAIVKLVKQAL